MSIKVGVQMFPMPQLETVQIELTSDCNERCVHCYLPHVDRNEYLSFQLLDKILDWCSNMKVKQIVFSGGEPMLHPEFMQIVSSAARKGFKIRIFSNFTLLNDSKIIEFKSYLANIHEVQTSLYSIEPGIHDAVTRLPGSCALTKKWIEKLIEQKFPVFICCPITTLNKNSYPGVLAYAKRLGLRSAPNNSITAQSDGGGQNLEYRLNIDDAVQVIQDILDNDTAYDAKRFSPEFSNIDNALPCVQNICRNTICINAKGEAILLPSWHKVLGDLNKETLQDIWEKPPEIQRLREISLKDFPKCASCPDIQFCGMSLEGNANENPQGDPFVIPKYVCDCARASRILVHSHKNYQEKQNNVLPAKI